MPLLLTASLVALALGIVLLWQGTADLSVRAATSDLRSALPSVIHETGHFLSKGLEKASGAPVSALIAAGVGVYVAIVRRDWRPGAIFIVMVVTLPLVSDALKSFFDRPSPTEWAQGIRTGRVFPSGHAAQALALWGFVAYLGGHSLQGAARRRVVAAGIALAVATGISRVLLDTHWLSDVLAGWGVGGLCLCGGIAVHTARRSARPPRREPDAATDRHDAAARRQPEMARGSSHR